MARKYSSTSIEQLLNASLGAGDTTVSLINSAAVTSLLGGVTLAAGNVDQFTVAIDPDTASEEIVFVRATSGNQLTSVVRGQAGTSATTHTAGATIKHVLTSDDLTAFATAISPVTNVQFAGSTSGSTTVQATAVAGTTTLTLPAATDTVVGRATTDTLTNKTIALGSNTVSGTIAQFNTALTDGDFATLVGTETLTNKTLTAPTINLDFNAQTGTTYTFALSDNSKLVTASNASAQTYSIPTDASVAFPVGAQINIQQIGVGQVTIQAVSSGTTTVTSTGATVAAPKLRTRYSAATCIKTAANTWTVLGDIS